MLLITKEEIASLREQLEAVRQRGAQYFDGAAPTQRGNAWELDGEDIRREAELLRAAVKALSVDVAGAARGSPLLAEADTQELRHNARRMLASVYFNEYQHAGVYVHHDEDVVLGVDPPKQWETPLARATDARGRFDRAAAKVLDLIDLLSPTDTIQSPASASKYRPNTAFIMMAIDGNNPELQEVRTVIKEVFEEFGVVAVTADEIEHDGAITDRILDEIETSEFLIADLSRERPNVYYEVGHAHARNKRVILFRRTDTRLHFDLAHRNCPEYADATDLRTRLRSRLEAMTNKRGPAGTVAT